MFPSDKDEGYKGGLVKKELSSRTVGCCVGGGGGGGGGGVGGWGGGVLQKPGLG